MREKFLSGTCKLIRNHSYLACWYNFKLNFQHHWLHLDLKKVTRVSVFVEGDFCRFICNSLLLCLHHTGWKHSWEREREREKRKRVRDLLAIICMVIWERSVLHWSSQWSVIFMPVGKHIALPYFTFWFLETGTLSQRCWSSWDFNIPKGERERKRERAGEWESITINSQCKVYLEQQETYNSKRQWK